MPPHVPHTLKRISARASGLCPPAPPGVHHSRLRDENAAPARLPQRPRRGRLLRALLAAAGRARRHKRSSYMRRKRAVDMTAFFSAHTGRGYTSGVTIEASQRVRVRPSARDCKRVGGVGGSDAPKSCLSSPNRPVHGSLRRGLAVDQLTVHLRAVMIICHSRRPSKIGCYKRGARGEFTPICVHPQKQADDLRARMQQGVYRQVGSTCRC